MSRSSCCCPLRLSCAFGRPGRSIPSWPVSLLCCGRCCLRSFCSFAPSVSLRLLFPYPFQFPYIPLNPRSSKTVCFPCFPLRYRKVLYFCDAEPFSSKNVGVWHLATGRFLHIRAVSLMPNRDKVSANLCIFPHAGLLRCHLQVLYLCR